jgi:hypothetical protein
MLTTSTPPITGGIKNTCDTGSVAISLYEPGNFTRQNEEVAEETGAYFLGRRNGMRVINIQEGGEGQ